MDKIAKLSSYLSEEEKFKNPSLTIKNMECFPLIANKLLPSFKRNRELHFSVEIYEILFYIFRN